MFKKKENPLEAALDKAILEIHNEMKTFSAEDEEYAKLTQQLKELHALKQKPEPVNPNTLLLIAGNLTGIAMIIGFEKSHVMTTKALNWVAKLR